MKDGAALQLNAIGVFEGQRDEVVVEHTAPAVEEADELVAVGLNSLSHSGVDHRIQAGAVAAAGQQSNSHRESLLIEFAAAAHLRTTPGIGH